MYFYAILPTGRNKKVNGKIVELVREFPESRLVVQGDSGDLLVSTAELVTWSDKGKIKSFYTDKEVARHKKDGNDLGPLHRLRTPVIRLILKK